MVPDTVVPPAQIEKFTDAQILAWVLTLDGNEVAAANVAGKKMMGPEATAYAGMLLDQHTADAAQTERLAKKLKVALAANESVDQLRSDGAGELAALSSLDGKDFEHAYIDAMAKGHAKALETIDSQLVPNAVNDAVKKRWAELRVHVAAHLDQAKRLQDRTASR